jgi:LPXTG-site transpeptidase (sortase) family protein
VQPDGQIVIGGWFNSYSYNSVTTAHRKIMRLNTDGSPDATFLSVGMETGGDVRALLRQTDDKIIAGGYFNDYNNDSTAPNNLIRINTDGTWDGSFTPGAGPYAPGYSAVDSLAFQSDNKIIVGGYFLSYDGVATAPDHLLRVTTGGLLDTDFNNGAANGTDDEVYALAVQPADGRILVGGISTMYNTDVKSPDNILRVLASAPPTVTINQASGQADPTNAAPINFTVVFSAPVTGFGDAAGDVLLSGTAGGPLSYTVTEVAPLDGTTYKVAVSGMSSAGTVIANVPADAALSGGIGNQASTSTDNQVTYVVPVTVTINQASGQPDPTNASPINFTVVFSASVTGFGDAAGDVVLSGTAGGPLSTTVTEVAPLDGTTYKVAVSGMSSAGTVIADVPADVAQAGNFGNLASSSTDNQVTYALPVTVTINQASGQPDPTNAAPINFTAVFSAAVTGFGDAAGDVVLSGSAGGPLSYTVTEVAPLDGTTYTVAVSGMSSAGTVIANIPADAALSGGLGNQASTSTDNQVTYALPLTVTIDQASGQADPTSASPINFTVVFSAAVTGFGDAAGDVLLSGTAGGPLSYTVTEIAPLNGTTYKVAVSGMSSSGTVIADVPAGAAQAGILDNQASTSTDNQVTYTLPLTVTINQASGQADPTNASPINFTVVFSAAVTGFGDAAGDVLLSGTAGGPLSYTVTEIAPLNGTTYTVAVSGMSSPGTVIADVPAGAAQSGNLGNQASTSTDNQVSYGLPLTVTINQASGQADPTNASPINFTVVFSAGVTGFGDAVGDVVLSGTAGGPLSYTVTEIAPMNGTTFTVAVSWMSSAGTVIADVPADAAQAGILGNQASTSTDNQVSYGLPLTVTIDQASGQPDPTNASPINFTVVFSAAVTGFGDAVGDVLLSGTAGGPLSYTVTEVAPMNGTTYTVAVSGMSTAGTVIANVPADAALSGGLGNLASTSMDNQVTYALTLVVTINQASGQADPTNISPINFTVVFSAPVTGFGDVVADVRLSGTAGATKSVVTEIAPMDGSTYKVAVSGMTRSGTVIAKVPADAAQAGGFGNAASTSTDNTVTFNLPVNTVPGVNHLPSTGFSQSMPTNLPAQPVAKLYTAYSDLRLNIPAIGVNLPIVGVPLSGASWDVTWLGQSAGWLNGTAFPTWSGNSVITGHVWDANNHAGPFVLLKSLRYGDQIRIYAWGQVYTYSVRQNELLAPTQPMMRLSTKI